MTSGFAGGTVTSTMSWSRPRLTALVRCNDQPRGKRP
jgi:hypothetical protein